MTLRESKIVIPLGDSHLFAEVCAGLSSEKCLFRACYNKQEKQWEIYI